MDRGITFALSELEALRLRMVNMAENNLTPSSGSVKSWATVLDRVQKALALPAPDAPPSSDAR